MAHGPPVPTSDAMTDAILGGHIHPRQEHVHSHSLSGAQVGRGRHTAWGGARGLGGEEKGWLWPEWPDSQCPLPAPGPG